MRVHVRVHVRVRVRVRVRVHVRDRIFVHTLQGFVPYLLWA